MNNLYEFLKRKFDPNQLKNENSGLEKLKNKLFFSIAQKEGRELSHMRTTDIPAVHQARLHDIAQKADQAGKFPDGVLTWKDYYYVGLAIWSLNPNAEKVRPSFWNSPEIFTAMMTKGNKIEQANPDAPITSEWGNEVRLWKFKLYVRHDHVNNVRQFAITPDDGDIGKAMTGVVYEKVRQAGLPFVDNSDLWNK